MPNTLLKSIKYGDAAPLIGKQSSFMGGQKTLHIVIQSWDVSQIHSEQMGLYYRKVARNEYTGRMGYSYKC